MAEIGYADKVALIENASVPEQNKVSAANMNEIKNVVNANAKDLLYSTTEVNTGKTWIDGKPIYRVCKNIGYLPNNGRIEPSFSGLIPLNVFVTNIYGIGERISTSAVDYRPLNEVTITLLYRSSTGTLYIDTDTDSSAYTGIVVIEYTKP